MLWLSRSFRLGCGGSGCRQGDLLYFSGMPGPSTTWEARDGWKSTRSKSLWKSNVSYFGILTMSSIVKGLGRLRASMSRMREGGGGSKSKTRTYFVQWPAAEKYRSSGTKFLKWADWFHKPLFSLQFLNGEGGVLFIEQKGVTPKWNYKVDPDYLDQPFEWFRNGVWPPPPQHLFIIIF